MIAVAHAVGPTGLRPSFETVETGYPALSLSPTEVQRVRSQTLIREAVHGRRFVGGMLAVCTAPGCTTLTMGGTCVAHDVPVTVVFPRGRPFAPERLKSVGRFAADSAVRAPVA